MNARIILMLMFLFLTIGLTQSLATAAPLNANDDGISQMNAVIASLPRMTRWQACLQRIQ